METTGAESRVSILLNALGRDVSQAILGAMSPEQATRLRERMSDLESDPPSRDEIDEVLDEFDRSLRLANHYNATAAQADQTEDAPELKLPQSSGGRRRRNHRTRGNDDLHRSIRAFG